MSARGIITESERDEIERRAVEKAARRQIAMEFDLALTDPVTRYLTQGLVAPPGELLEVFHSIKYSRFWYFANKRGLLHDGQGHYWLAGLDKQRDKAGMPVFSPDGTVVLLPDPEDPWVRKLLPVVYEIHSMVGVFSPKPKILTDMLAESMEEHPFWWPFIAQRRKKRKPEPSIWEKLLSFRKKQREEERREREAEGEGTG